MTAIKLLDSEKWDLREFEILRAFREKASLKLPAEKVYTFALGPQSASLRKERIEVLPYESLA